MATDSLGELKIYLTGDSSGYLNSLKQAEGATKQTATKLEKDTATASKQGMSAATASVQSAKQAVQGNVAVVEELSAASGKAATAQDTLKKATGEASASMKKGWADGKGLTEILTAMPTKVLGVVGMAGAVAGLGAKLSDAYANTRKFNESLRDMESLLSRQGKIQSKETSAIFERIDKAGGRSEQTSQAEKELAKAKETMELQKKFVQEARKRADDADSIWKNKKGLKIAEADLKTQEQLLEGYKDRVDEIQTKLTDLQANKKLKEDITSLNTSLKEQAQIAELMANNLNITTSEVDVFKLKLQGATEEQLKFAESQAQSIKASEFRKQTNELTRDLSLQIKTFGMMPDQVKAAEMALKGFTSEQIASVQKLNLQLQGKQVTEQYALPQEKLAKGVGELDRLLSAGTITMETYERGVADLTKQFQGLKAAIDPIQGAAEGSAEALSRLLAYQANQQSGPVREVGFFGRAPMPQRPQQPPNREPMNNPVPPNQNDQNGKQDRMVDLLQQLVDFVKKGGGFDFRIGGGG